MEQDYEVHMLIWINPFRSPESFDAWVKILAAFFTTAAGLLVMCSCRKTNSEKIKRRLTCWDRTCLFVGMALIWVALYSGNKVSDRQAPGKRIEPANSKAGAESQSRCRLCGARSSHGKVQFESGNVARNVQRPNSRRLFTPTVLEWWAGRDLNPGPTA